MENDDLMLLALQSIHLAHKKIVFERVYFEAEKSDNGVTMFASIDGGPLLSKKECKTKEQIFEFIDELKNR